MRKEFKTKRLLAFALAIMMLITAFPLQAMAKDFDHENIVEEKSNYINNVNDSIPIKPVVLPEGKAAADYINNPNMPKLYTMRADFKVPRNDEEIVGYQPYIATVGDDKYTYTDLDGNGGQKVLTDAEKKSISHDVNLPDIDGYTEPTPKFNVNYEYIQKNALKGTQDGEEHNGDHPYLYEAKQGTIKIKHTFQKLENRDEYGYRDGDTEYIYTYQNGVTGTSVTIKALDGEKIKGYVPEVNVLTTQVPQNSTDFEIEMRYNRAIYDVNFDSNGGTDLPGMTLIYGQTVPKLNFDIEKLGAKLQGWKVNKDITYTDQAGTKQTLSKDTLIKKEDFETGGKFEAGIKNAMPAESITFTAEWTENKKAEYVIQFWTEKPDYDDKDDTLPLRDRYDFIGARRIDDADTGSTPDLTDLDIHGITFPDLNDGRLEKAQKNKEEFERYYFLNEGLTKKQNASKENPNVQKSVLSTGETVYNIYYDRRVYTLYFTAASGEAFDIVGSFWPIITRDGQVIGQEGSPYKVDVRFNQSLDKIWPKDAEVSNLPTSFGNEEGDTGLIGWTINNNAGEQAYRDTPPYRLSAEDFIDSQDVVGTGEFEGFGHSDQIPIKDGENKKRDKYEISIGSTSYDQAVVHHIDIIKDDFDGKEQIDYDMSYWKSDTSAAGPNGYPFGLPHLQGFTLKEDTRTAEWIGLEKGRVGTWDARKTFDELNKERNKKTPFRSDADKIEYIDKFPWGTKSFNGVNAYNYANYTRNKYKLKLNNDPKTVKNDSEYGAGNILDVPYEKPLKDLKLDTTHKPERPDWVSDDWSFLGWALDPAGENLVKDGKETKLHYDQVLYAKWGEPETIWKVKFDPNGGSLADLSTKNISDESKKLEINGEEHTYPEKVSGEKYNTFNFVHKMILKEPKDGVNNVIEPKRDGYNFAGWEFVRYTKDKDGNDTKTVDTSYKDLYKVPEMYHFGNKVVGNVHLRAIWNKQDLITVEAIHHFLNADYSEKSKEVQNLYNRRVGSYTTGLGSRQGDKYLLVPQAEWDALYKANADYKTYKDETARENSYNQILRVEPKKVHDPNTGALVDNPKAKNNRFEFFYRPFKERVYEVNYLDDRCKEEVETFISNAKAAYQNIKTATFNTPEQKSDAYKKLLADNKAAFKEIKEKYAIIPNETVVNGKRHYDARNYRRIPGWVLNDKPQKQLFFDLYEETDTFAGINETGLDEIYFFYKDVRVVEVKDKDDPLPKGYVRVTFKADEGGSFTDSKDNPVKEFYYDVIVGLKSDNIPVPQEFVGGKNEDGTEKQKEEGKYYITPDGGKKFTHGDNEKLLNKDTIINKSYDFTAYFDWSGVKVNEIVKTEAYKGDGGKWVNDFAPKIEELKKQIKWVDKDGKESALPQDAVVTILDDAGNEITQEGIYEKVKELNRNDSTELVRTVKFPAKIKFADNSVQEIEIPVKIYKNVYEALTSGEMPKVLKDATAADGDLADVTGNYVKVTVNPTNKPGKKDSKIYYVNKNAWVNIPEVDISEDAKKLGLTRWAADKDTQNENGEFDFDKRHKFTEDTIITPGFTNDVVEQTDPDKKPDVPDGYVKIIVKSTDKATTEFTKIFWVNPTKEVTVQVDNPVGKTVEKTATEEAKAYTFTGWKSDESPARTWASEIKGQFENDTTIEAQYDDVKNIIPYDPDEPTTRPKGYVRVTFAVEKGLNLTEQKAYYVKKNAGIKLGNAELAKPKYNEETGYEFNKWDKEDTLEIGDADIVVTAKATKLNTAIPEKDDEGNPNTKPDGYKEVVFKVKDEDQSKGSLDGVTKFYVNPNEYVTINPPTTNANTGYEFGAWDKDAKIPTVYKDEVTTITASFNQIKDVIPKTKSDDSEKPDGYKTVTFVIDPATGGQIVDKEVTVYYVNPNREVTINPPQTIAETGYEFNAWDKNTTVATNYAVDTTVRGSFSKLEDIIPATDDEGNENPKPDGYVTVTFEKGDHGKEIAGQTIYYVNPKANPVKTLANIAKPTVKAEVGYKFKSWNFADTKEIRSDITVTAQYAPIDDVIPEKKDDGTPNEKPEGYITVTFDKGKYGKELTGQAVYYVNPNKAVVLEGKAPIAVPNKGYTFARWDTSIEKAIQYKDGDKITALYNEPGNISETEVAGYVKVEFNKGQHGSLKGKTEYWIKPGVEVNIPAPTVKPNVGYKFDKWNKDLTVTLNANDPTYVITAEYEDLGNIIPQKNTDGSDKPDGYHTVTFKAVNGSLEGTTTYYVKPDVEVDLTNVADALGKKADVGYAAEGGTWDKPLTATFTQDAEYTFNFAKLGDVIPKTTDDESEKPEGYVSVKFIPTANAVDSTEKVYYVNPKANVTLPIADPVGKEVTDESGTKYTFNFKLWTVTRGNVATWDKGTQVSGVFIQDTAITAKYNVEYKQLINGPVPKDDVVTGKGDVPAPEDLIKNIPGSGEKDSLPEGTTFTYTNDGTPDVSNPGTTTAKVEARYPDGKTTVVEVPITVVDNVVPQIGNDKPLVPDNYVKVTVDTTVAATDNTYFVKTFWVKPSTVVWIPVNIPTGKVEAIDGVMKTNNFINWVSDDNGKTYTTNITDEFTREETNIVAKYEFNKNIEPQPNNDQWIPKGSDPKAKDFINNPYDDNDPKNMDNLPPGTSFDFVPGTEPDTNEPGVNKTTTIKVTYPNGEVKYVDVTYNVTEDVVEQVDDRKPIVPDKFVEVVVDTTDLATRETYSFKTYWVNPDRMVTIPTGKPKGIKDDKDNREWLFDYWQRDLASGEGTRYRDVIEDRFTEDTYIKACYYKADIPEPGSDYVVTDVNVFPDVDEYRSKITPPVGKKIDYVTILKQPDVSKAGNRTYAEVEVVYTDGTRSTVWVPVYVQRPGETNTRIVYRDRIVEKEKIVEKIVKIKDNQRLKEVRFMQGFEGKFRPHDGLTRAEAAQILANALKQDGYNYNPAYPINYKDVKQKWYTEAIVITTQANVFKGYDDGYFRPEEKISRAEWIATLKRFQQLQDVDGNRMGLKENHWATREVEAAYEEGWLQIYTNGNAKFDANEPITREEVAAVSNRAFGRLVDKTYIMRNDKSVINYKDINPSMWSYADILCASNSFIRDENYYMSHGIEYIKTIVNNIEGTIIFNVQLKNLEIIQDKFQRYLR